MYLRRKYLSIQCFLMFVVIAVLCTSCSNTPLSWLLNSPEPIQVLVPVGYEGPVLIVYEVPNGTSAEKTQEFWLYRLQPDGVLLLQNSPPQSIVTFSFWYEKKNGDLSPILQDNCFSNSKTEKVVVCTGGTVEVYNGHKLRPNQSFYIGYLINQRTEWKGEQFFQLYNQYLKQLTLPETK